MPTVRTVTIKPAGGGDYSTLISWNSARKRNLVAADEIERVECYSGDIGPSNIFGWTMDATRYVEIVVAAGHQHQGKWDATKCYMLAGVNGINITDAGSIYTRIRGLQVQHNASLASVYGIRASASGYMGIIEQCLIKRTGTGANQYGISVTGSPIVRNNIVYDYSASGCVAFLAQGSVPKYLNNTAYNCWRGYNFAFGAPYSRNCLAAACVDGFYATVGDHDYNASDLAADAPGVHSRNGQVFSFVNAAGRDLHLQVADQGALRRGVDLSAQFTDDIDGKTRIGLWDIGADQHDPESHSALVDLSGSGAASGGGVKTGVSSPALSAGSGGACSGVKATGGAAGLDVVAALACVSGRLALADAALLAAPGLDADGAKGGKGAAVLEALGDPTAMGGRLALAWAGLSAYAALSAVSGRLAQSGADLSARALAEASGTLYPITDLPGAFLLETPLDEAFSLATEAGADFHTRTDEAGGFGLATALGCAFALGSGLRGEFHLATDLEGRTQ